MVELCLMASHGYPPGLGGFHPELVSNRVSEDFQPFVPYHGSNQHQVNPVSFNLNLQQNQLFNSNNFVGIDSISKRPPLIDFQETHPDSIHFSYGIVDRCTRHEQILKLLASKSVEEIGGLVDLSMLYDIMGPQFDDQALPYLIYPHKELYFNEPLLDLVGEAYYSGDGQVPYNYTGTETNDMLSVISDFYSSKNTNKSSKQTMLVPYFERRRRARANTDASKLANAKLTSLNSHDKVKEKTPHKKKTSTRIGKDRDTYGNSYLHACESLLSIIVDRNQQEGKKTIMSLKKSGPQLPQLLTQFSASIAGTGIAVILSILCRVVCSRVPFCGSKLLTTGLGLGLVWLSWAVNRLRDTLISITKTSRKLGEKEDEMMVHLDGNLKDIYFRAAALMAVVVLKVA
ncbi:hypothetical protein ACP275_04G025400 [Erythranthe tilingii]